MRSDNQHLVVAVAGYPGTGTSGLAQGLALVLPLILGVKTDNPFPVFNPGRVVRDMAMEHRVTLEEFNKIMESDRTFDDTVDARVQAAVLDLSRHIIIDSRLAAFFAKDAFRIRLTCADEIAARRIQADRLKNNRVEEEKSTDLPTILKSMQKRLNSENGRYEHIYPGYTPDYIVDLVIDTTDITQFEVLQTAYCAIMGWYRD